MRSGPSGAGDHHPVAPGATPADAEHGQPAEPFRPRISPRVGLSELPPPSDYGVALSPRTGRYIKLGLRQFALLRSLDGSRTAAELEQTVEREGLLPAGMVRPLVERFATLGLLEGFDDAAESESTRFQSLTSIRFPLLDPGPWLSRLEPMAGRLLTPVGMTLSLLLAGSGLGSLLARYQVAAPSIASGAGVAVAVLVLLVLTTIVHELGHALVLTHFGGRPGRMGLMIFYLTPAAFCDVSDAWRLPPRRRALVSLGGLWAQSITFGAGGLLLWLPLPATIGTTLTVYLAISFFFMLANLDPFIKLDGYWIVAHLIDIPNLREHALTAAGEVVGALLVGRRPSVPGRHRVVLFWFGVASILVTPVILIAALLNYQSLLLDLGRPGAALWLALAALVLGAMVVRAVSALRQWARRRPGLGPRIAAGGGALIAATVLALVLIPAGVSVPGRWQKVGAGVEVNLYLSPPRAIKVGDAARLYEQSWLGPSQSSSAQVSSVRTARQAGVDIGKGQSLSSDSGPAFIQLGDSSLAGYLYWTYLAPPIGLILGNSSV